MAKTSKKEHSIVKLNSELYEKVRQKVHENRVDFPSIKNFIEKAVANLLDLHMHKQHSTHTDHANSSKENHHHVPSGIG